MRLNASGALSLIVSIARNAPCLGEEYPTALPASASVAPRATMRPTFRCLAITRFRRFFFFASAGLGSSPTGFCWSDTLHL
jgi:hypothetical protein